MCPGLINSFIYHNNYHFTTVLFIIEPRKSVHSNSGYILAVLGTANPGSSNILYPDTVGSPLVHPDCYDPAAFHFHSSTVNFG